MQKNKNKLTLNSWIQTNQILTNDDDVCIPRLSSILLAAQKDLDSAYQGNGHLEIKQLLPVSAISCYNLRNLSYQNCFCLNL